MGTGDETPLEGREQQANFGADLFWEPDEFDYEPLDRYCEGGYCPVSIWQTFHLDRYRVAYKLGRGHFSTVWLAQDFQEKRYVALKFLTADQYGRSSEADMLRVFADSEAVHSREDQAKRVVIRLLDSFNYESANGKHHVLVMPVSRSLMGMRSRGMNFLTVVKALVEAVDCLHTAGIVHGGRSNAL